MIRPALFTTNAGRISILEGCILDKQTKRLGDLIFSLIMLAFVLTIVISSSELHSQTRRLPLLVAFFTIAFIFWSDAIELSAYLKAKKSPTEDDKKKGKPIPFKKIAVSVGLMALSLILWRLIGFIPGSLAASIPYVLYLGERRPAVVILAPTVTTIALYFLFARFLMVPLPTGIIWSMFG